MGRENMVGFVDAVKMFFGRYTDFKGRSSRSEYWWWALANFLITLVPMFLLMGSMDMEAAAMGDYSSVGGIWFIILGIWWLITLIPSIALVVRRFHDLNQTGWLYLGFLIVMIIPIVGLLAVIGMIVWFCMRGTVGPNKYGEDPLGDNGAVFE